MRQNYPLILVRVGWWRQGTNPLRLPLTVSGRPDAIMYADQGTQTKRGKTRHSAEIHVLFEDYSQTGELCSCPLWKKVKNTDAFPGSD